MPVKKLATNLACKETYECLQKRRVLDSWLVCVSDMLGCLVSLVRGVRREVMHTEHRATRMIHAWLLRVQGMRASR